MKKYSIVLTAGTLSLLGVLLLSAARPSQAPAQGGLKASMDRGKVVYQQRCLACHQADAGGVENMNPPLVKTTYVLGNKTALVKILLNGLTGGVTINGDSYHNNMPSQADLTDQQIADVLTFVRNNFGNKAPQITLAQVTAARKAAAVSKAAPPVKH
jgi:mono/diheme cytochrome c family protein